MGKRGELDMSSRKTKYYYAVVEERHGEFENRESVLFKTRNCPAKYHDKIVENWYESLADDLLPVTNKDGWYWNDCMMYGGGRYDEISKTTYMELKNQTNLVEL